MQIAKTDRIDSGIDQRHGFLVKAGSEILIEDGSCFNCQRTVHINRKIHADQIVFFDFADKIQQFLCTPHCKRRDDQISAPAQCMFDHICQFGHMIGRCIVQTIAVGGFHYNVISSVRILGIFNQGAVGIAHISGKYDLFLNIVFFNPDLDRSGAEQMSYITEADLDAGAKVDLLLITAWMKQIDCAQRVFHCIERYIFLCAGTFCFPVAPFCLEFLDMRTVSKHDIAQIIGGKSRDNLSLKTVLVQKRQTARMINMCMR